MLEHIPTGKANATSVPALATATGLSTRKVRLEIARLVNEERIPVVTSPTPGGSVYLAANPEELQKAIKTARSRALGNLRRARSWRLCSEALEWSPELFPGAR